MNEMKLKRSLFSLRIGVLIVMLVWTVDKFIQPAHAAKIFEKFYMIAGITDYSAYAIGALQLVLLFLFTFGFYKRFSYGCVFFMHAVSTISSWQKYINPWENGTLLFFAAIPMLAACYTLYIFREEDTILNLNKEKK